MKKIKFKIEYVPLSDERIERHKDFDKLLSAYIAHPKPSWKTRMFGNKYLVYMGGIITGAALTSLVWWNVSHFNGAHFSVEKNSHTSSGAKTEQVQNNSVNENSSDNILTDTLLVKKQNENAVANRNSASEEKNENASSQNEESNASNRNPISSRNRISSPEKKGNEKASTQQKQVNHQSGKKLSDSSKVVSTAFATKNSNSQTASSQNISALNSEITSEEDSKTIAEKSQATSSEKSHVEDSNSESSSQNISSQKQAPQDTLQLQSEVLAAEIDTPLSSLPADSSKKGIHINLPKIDLSGSETVVKKVADSIGKKTDSFFSRLFPKDSAKDEKSPEEISAQNEIPDSFKHRYAQISFVTPISSDGENAKDYMHNLSFNVLQGYTGALEGVEFGGLANIEAGYVTGVQFGGLTNYVFGDVKGVQFGGLLNYGKNLEGAQFSGLVSTAVGNVHGAQVAGVTNFVLDTFVGLQLAGVVNLAIANKPSTGWQVSGATNVSLGDLHGGQLTGAFNIANRLHGVQIGTINFANKITGFQLGIINIADSIRGEALGIFSVSANGQHHMDVFGSEILYGSVALKLGSPHIYNIFAAGAAPMKDTVRLGFGIGIGGHFPINHVFINVDGIVWTIHNDNLRDWNYVNLWNQIRVMAGYQFTKGFAAYAGPTLNAHVYDPSYPAIAPYLIYDSQGTTNVQGWIGFVVGLQFF